MKKVFGNITRGSKVRCCVQYFPERKTKLMKKGINMTLDPVSTKVLENEEVCGQKTRGSSFRLSLKNKQYFDVLSKFQIL